MMLPDNFHPSIQSWFADTFPQPTGVQSASWPTIAGGDHVLITAPTGSGKTLTAFTWALSEFASGRYPTGATKVLYISPLKALNADIQRNLFAPLKALHADYGYPKVRVGLRSGDTSASDRQKLLRHPPDILITTPESLGLMLTTVKGRMALAAIETVILDEIHSLVDNRRGVLLMTHIERLAALAGEFQRIALSATISPLPAVANYVAGYDQAGKQRSVTIVDPPANKAIEFRVRFPEAAKHAAEQGKKIWDPLSEDFREIIDDNNATLFFTNSRRLAEKITLKINEDIVAPVAYAHHGSLAREIRTEVESRLKAGELKAIVATSSLEMGIDVGHLDEVVLVQSPSSIAATLQRIGRSGHGVGETSIGTLYPTHTQDFLSAAVLSEAVAEREIEPLRPMHGPLDVLAQIILSVTATDPWHVDEIYRLICRASPYHKLPREHFDLVLEMLAGRYAGSRIRELKPRIDYDRINMTVQATRGAILALYNSGGTIPDRGYYQLRHADTGGVIGELDEEFVWEATIGDRFTLGTQHWQIQRITHNDVIVRAAPKGSSAPPFWRAEFFNRSYFFSNRIAQFLEMQESHLAQKSAEEVTGELCRDYGFEATAAAELVEFLTEQRTHTQAPLPHRHLLVLELIRGGPAGYRGPDDPQQLVLHTYWGGQLNQPFALALRAAWAAKYQHKLDVHADNNAIVLQCKGEIDPHEIMTLVRPDNVLDLLRQSLEQSGFFGARFRECAGRSLLLSKQKFNQRLPLWMSRMQAKKLMTQVKKIPEFPVMLETWRTCLDDEFDMASLHTVLSELQDGTIAWQFVTTTTPSPFAQDLTFNQVSRYMYADDQPEDDESSTLATDFITQALQNEALRPAIQPHIIAEFVQKRQRLRPDYRPEDLEDWHQWLKERILIPVAEVAEPIPDSPMIFTLKVGDGAWLTHLELVWGLYQSGLVAGEDQNDPPDHIPEVEDLRSAWQMAREILSFYGPVTEREIVRLLPVMPEELLIADETFIVGELVDGSSEIFYCDADNLEILLRMQRAERRSSFDPLPAESLPSFWASLARLHYLADPANTVYALESLRGYSASIKPLAQDLVASRLRGADLASIESTFASQGMRWIGTGSEQIALAYPEDLQLIRQAGGDSTVQQWFNDSYASYRYDQVADRAGLRLAELNKTWWQDVWAGHLTADGLTPLLDAHGKGFDIPTMDRISGSRRRRPRLPSSWSGQWQLLHLPNDVDPLTALEDDKDRVRLLLDRYGFLCREVVNREGWRDFRWRHAFRALRIMELGGEVIAGQFFLQLATPQFIAPNALSQLTTNSAQAKNFWISALDPVAPSGLGLDWPDLPHRREGNYLSFYAGELALTATGHGRSLHYLVPWHHPGMDEVNGLLTHLAGQSRQRIVINEINGEPARQSPYLAGLKRLFTLGEDHKSVFIDNQY